MYRASYKAHQSERPELDLKAFMTCLVAAWVNALLNHGIAEAWLLSALPAILRMLPEQVLAMPPELCFRNYASHHQLLMQCLKVPAITSAS